jgi:lipoate-protein ligase B|tara:strand:- start:1260 stop:1922 length:663 start_codon:yes stop_codon:yes gene_type:complete
MFDSSMITNDVKEVKINTMDLGKRSYKEVWNLQKKMQKKRMAGEIDDLLILVEHDPVYTLGKNADVNHLLQSRDRTIEVFNVERGGDITFHGPGQLVGYPIIDLVNYKKSVSWYMRSLEQLTIEVLSEFEISAKRVKGLTGVWVGDKKIAAQGVRLTRWVTMHGFSINVNTELSYYNGIIPCGIFDHGVTSMEELLGSTQKIEKIRTLVIDKFNQIFMRN